MMLSIDDREQNLFRATETMAQFYDEIESFLQILRDSMAKADFGLVNWRLRSGTFSYRNLTRRLLATATMMYFKGSDDTELEDEEAADEIEEADEKKVGKRSIVIDPSLKIPFVMVWLFRPTAIPSTRTLSSPQLLVGAFSNFTFSDKKTGQKAAIEKPELALSNLAQLSPRPTSGVGEHITTSCWRPTAMRKFTLDAEIVAWEKHRLLDFDSHEKIQAVAQKLAGYCDSADKFDHAT